MKSSTQQLMTRTNVSFFHIDKATEFLYETLPTAKGCILIIYNDCQGLESTCCFTFTVVIQES